MGQKKCKHCNAYKDEEEFKWRYKALGIRNKACREYMVAFNRNYYKGEDGERHLQQVKERTERAREAAREYVYQYLFHPLGEKDMAITRLVTGGLSIKRIQAEIAKCNVSCANCHRKTMVDQRGWYRERKRLPNVAIT